MVYVIREVVAARETYPELLCPHCQTNGKIEISLIRTDVRVGLIPMLSGRKRGEAVCQNCGLSVKLTQAGDAFKRAYLALKAKTRTPLYLWSGMILCCLVLFGVVAHMVYEEHNNPWTQKIDPAILSAPQVGDLLEVSVDRTGDMNAGTTGYTLARVEGVEGDLVTLRYRKNVINSRSPLLLEELLKAPGVFDDRTIEVQKKPLEGKDLFPPKSDSIGMIYAAKRP